MSLTVLIARDDAAGKLLASRLGGAFPPGAVKWFVLPGRESGGGARPSGGAPLLKWVRRLPGDLLEGAGRAPLSELVSYRRFRDAAGYLRDACRRELERLAAPLLASGPPPPERTDRLEGSRWICLDYGSLLAAEPRLGRGGAGTILNLHPGILPLYPGSNGLIEALYRRDILGCGTTLHPVSAEGLVTAVWETTFPRFHPREGAPTCVARALIAGVLASVAILAGEAPRSRAIEPVALHPGRESGLAADAVLRDFARGWLPAEMAAVKERRL